jgi:hypothetical protein
MPEIGDIREAPVASKEQRRAQERLRNQAKNEARRKARAEAKKLPKEKAEHAKVLRSAFGGAFGKAPTKVFNSARLGTSAAERMESSDELYRAEDGSWDFQASDDVDGMIDEAAINA